MKQRGFTLIEIVVALGIFAIIAAMTSYILAQSFDTNKHLKHQSIRLHQLEMAVVMMRRETAQIINRPIRGNEQSLLPAFIAHADGVEFTRCGDINPNADMQRSTLKRVAYLCYGHQLIRRTWTLLDTPDRTQFHDKVVFEGLKACSFTYMDRKHHVYPEWKIVLKDQKKQRAPLPTSIICHLDLEKWGVLNIVLPLPAGLYG